MFVEAADFKEDSQPLKDPILNLMEKGKNMLYERMKLIRYADKETWRAALLFEGDDIADNETEEKKMKKSKKEAEKEVEKAKQKATRAGKRDS